jgi:hypothetical protein
MARKTKRVKKRPFTLLNEAIADKPINPDRFYRLNLCPFFLGLSVPMLRALANRGEIDPPVKLSESGRACGYYGSTLIAIKNRRLKDAAA